MTAKKIQLEAAREALAAALAASKKGDKLLSKLDASRAGVATEIEQLEVATEENPDDESGIARLATLRERLRLLDKKFARLQTEQLHDESPRIALADALSESVRVLIEAGRPTTLWPRSNACKPSTSPLGGAYPCWPAFRSIAKRRGNWAVTLSVRRCSVSRGGKWGGGRKRGWRTRH